MSIKQILASAIQPEANNNGQLELVSLEDMDMMSDLHNVELEIMESEEAISAVENVITGLEGLHDAISVYQENSGLDFQSASLLNASIEVIMAPFGGNTQALPSQEAYEGGNGRKVATAYAMEGVSATIKSMWAAIVALFKKAKDAIVKWFKGNASRLEKVKKAAYALARANQGKKYKAKAGKLKISSPELMYTDGKFVGGTHDGIDMLYSLSGVSAKVEDYDSIVAGVIFEADISNKAGGDKFIEYLESVIKTNIKYAVKGKEVKDDRVNVIGGRVYRRTEVLPGNAFIASVVTGKRLPRLYFLKPVKDKKLEGASEPGLDSAKITPLCYVIVKVAKKFIDVSADISRIEFALSELEKTGERLAKQVKDDTPSPVHKTVKRALSTITVLNHNYTTVYMEMVKYTTRVLYASYNYAKASHTNLDIPK